MATFDDEQERQRAITMQYLSLFGPGAAYDRTAPSIPSESPVPSPSPKPKSRRLESEDDHRERKDARRERRRRDRKKLEDKQREQLEVFLKQIENLQSQMQEVQEANEKQRKAMETEYQTMLAEAVREAETKCEQRLEGMRDAHKDQLATQKALMQEIFDQQLDRQKALLEEQSARALEDEMSALQKQYEEEVSSVREAHEIQEKTNADQKTEIAKLQLNIEQMTAKIQTLEGERDSLRDEVTTLNTKFQEAQTVASGTPGADEVTELLERTEKLASQLETANELAIIQSEANEALEKEVAKLKRELASADEQIEEWQNEYTDLQYRYEDEIKMILKELPIATSPTALAWSHRFGMATAPIAQSPMAVDTPQPSTRSEMPQMRPQPEDPQQTIGLLPQDTQLDTEPNVHISTTERLLAAASPRTAHPGGIRNRFTELRRV